MVKKVFSCPTMRVLGKIAEPTLWQSILEIFENPKLVGALVAEGKKVFEKRNSKPDEERLKRKIQGLQIQLEALTERLSQLPKNVSASTIFKQMEKIETLKLQDEALLAEVEAKGYMVGVKLPPNVGIRRKVLLDYLRLFAKNAGVQITYDYSPSERDIDDFRKSFDIGFL